MNADDQKRIAGEHAANLVEEGMIVGLGTGSTAEKAVHALGRRFKEGLKFTGVPTSDETGQLAQSYGIPLVRLDELEVLDLTIDGSDEVDPQLELIKGHGGALVREKLVARTGRRFIVIVDESKLVERLGQHMPVPVEVVAFGWTTTRHRLDALGLTCELRGGSQPVPDVEPQLHPRLSPAGEAGSTDRGPGRGHQSTNRRCGPRLLPQPGVDGCGRSRLGRSGCTDSLKRPCYAPSSGIPSASCSSGCRSSMLGSAADSGSYIPSSLCGGISE